MRWPGSPGPAKSRCLWMLATTPTLGLSSCCDEATGDETQAAADANATASAPLSNRFMNVPTIHPAYELTQHLLRGTGIELVNALALGGCRSVGDRAGDQRERRRKP